jgi:hypothetical protein
MRPPQTRYQSLISDSARWAGFAFREGDIVISTPPKCGTTWTQMICALLIFQSPDLPRPLDLLSPWLDQLLRPLASVTADLEAQQHRRFIKTHTPLDGLPFDDRVTYIAVGRDPRDAALSFDQHMANLDWSAALALREAAVGLDDLPPEMRAGPPPPAASAKDRFWSWVEEPTAQAVGLASLLRHLATFYTVRNEPNVLLLHYSELKADLAGQMRGLADRLGIEVAEEQWRALTHAAGFAEMRRRASEVAPNHTENVWRDGREFFHRARLGEWRALLDEADLRRYAERAQHLADPDLLDWVHRGPIIPT